MRAPPAPTLPATAQEIEPNGQKATPLPAAPAADDHMVLAFLSMDDRC